MYQCNINRIEWIFIGLIDFNFSNESRLPVLERTPAVIDDPNEPKAPRKTKRHKITDSPIKRKRRKGQEDQGT